MANREAIKELQTRLASRLQAARDEGLAISWLAVQAGDANYLLPLGQSGEIFPVAQMQPVPYTQPWFRGVVNLRGGLYGVVELAAFVATEGGRPLPPARAAGGGSTVVTLNPALDVNCALLVDTLAGLRNPEAFGSARPPAAGAPAYFGNAFDDAQGQRWQEINLQTLSRQPRFLHITA